MSAARACVSAKKNFVSNFYLYLMMANGDGVFGVMGPHSWQAVLSCEVLEEQEAVRLLCMKGLSHALAYLYCK